MQARDNAILSRASQGSPRNLRKKGSVTLDISYMLAFDDIIILDLGEDWWCCGWSSDSGPSEIVPAPPAQDSEAFRVLLASVFAALKAEPSECVVLVSEVPGIRPLERERVAATLVDVFRGTGHSHHGGRGLAAGRRRAEAEAEAEAEGRAEEGRDALAEAGHQAAAAVGDGAARHEEDGV